jgi:hypothetical protein
VNSSFVQRSVFLGILALSSVMSAHQMARYLTCCVNTVQKK